MSDLRLDSGFVDHPKTGALVLRCGWEGVGALLRLWGWTRDNRPRGDLVGVSRDDLERYAGWRGARGQFVDALIAVPGGERAGFFIATADGFQAYKWDRRQGWSLLQAAKADRAEAARTAGKASAAARAAIHGSAQPRTEAGPVDRRNAPRTPEGRFAGPAASERTSERTSERPQRTKPARNGLEIERRPNPPSPSPSEGVREDSPTPQEVGAKVPPPPRPRGEVSAHAEGREAGGGVRGMISLEILGARPNQRAQETRGDGRTRTLLRGAVYAARLAEVAPESHRLFRQRVGATDPAPGLVLRHVAPHAFADLIDDVVKRLDRLQNRPAYIRSSLADRLESTLAALADERQPKNGHAP